MSTIANNLAAFSPTHPGEVIKEELEYRGISQRKLAGQMGISYTVLNEILNCKRPVSTEFAILIEAALGIEADMFVRMQTRYNMQLARKDKKLINRFNEVRKVCAIL
jgi:addiction module HigA family antidote